MRKMIESILPWIDFAVFSAVYPAAYFLKTIRKAGVGRMPLCRRALMQVGVFPIMKHYYEPMFDSRALHHSLEDTRSLPGINWNIPEQLTLLDSFHYGNELEDTPTLKTDDLTYYLGNANFKAGDAEFLYNLIRLKKPANIFEIGSGNSTLMAIQAIKKNQAEDPTYQCQHLCVEPYEMPWLEKTGVSVVRQRVEELDKTLFAQLGDGDLLFIDSSHIIRPQGDVLFEYLDLLPSLNKGVMVHIHDIFSPRDYPSQWVTDEVRLWNEQYLLEAFLSCNQSWKVLAAVNYLHHNHFSKLKEKCPFLSDTNDPGSFYIQKVV
ncbi:MAG: hypothetical protein RL122_300 [Pseudomonadota bacterium]|jgi:predicted O-methyltransferase YrrM|uniref:Class I SAM-dependent methyltransferase n=1 Tax=Thiothrix fructosivorans TaxID=111770 RepID=A0A8B0SBD4_9GAMM|nr:class I SAM-dependent methyltransferase [Thiothrix fructosivorans]MBO0614400.1 class I SAM-dependent methyltransferase [Thiothrix fructosivorans]QTX09243.1 class I SAM-dependent methyltransferase [Thiothrix fructosivorans]